MCDTMRLNELNNLSAPVPETPSKFKSERNTADLAMPLPQGIASSKITKINWSGLNYRQNLDTGVLSYENNISTEEAPYLTPSRKRNIYASGYANPISMFGFDDFLLIVYSIGSTAYIDYINAAGNKYTGTLGSSHGNTQRSIVKFNVYDTPTDPISGNYVQKLLIFPDKKSMDFTITSNFTPANLDSGINQVPNIQYATVHLSRLFGVDNDRVYASGFNDYSNWNLDTVLEQNTSNAWCSPAQANTKANGKFTGITTFQNHVICFKRDYMHEIYNNKNPFRIYDIFQEGTIENRSVVDVGGQLIFTANDGVKVYTGGKPRNIGYYLGADNFTKAVAGTDGRRYYLYCSTEKKPHNLFVYDTYINQWSEEAVNFEVLGFAKTSTGMYMLGSDGGVYKLDTNNYTHNWSAETDFYSGSTIDIKHIQKVQMLADIAAGSTFEAYLLYDGETFNASTSHKICSHTNNSGGVQKIPIRVVPRQTANYCFKLHMNGYGYTKLYQLELSVKQGGELFK